MSTINIQNQFDSIAKQYDNHRKCFIPCYDDYYVRSVSLLKQYKNNFKHVVDLGAGTGLLTQEIFSLYPQAQYTLIDLSKDMLEIAQKRFNGLNNFKYVAANYIDNIPYHVDLICSALSIHHLDVNEKKQIYNNIFQALEKDGCFITLDQFISSFPSINDLYNKWWLNYIKSSGITPLQFEAWTERKKLDKENTIDDTISLLRNSGFKNVQCIYSFMKFGVIIAIK